MIPIISFYESFRSIKNVHGFLTKFLTFLRFFLHELPPRRTKFRFETLADLWFEKTFGSGVNQILCKVYVQVKICKYLLWLSRVELDKVFIDRSLDVIKERSFLKTLISPETILLFFHLVGFESLPPSPSGIIRWKGRLKPLYDSNIYISKKFGLPRGAWGLNESVLNSHECTCILILLRGIIVLRNLKLISQTENGLKLCREC